MSCHSLRKEELVVELTPGEGLDIHGYLVRAWFERPFGERSFYEIFLGFWNI